MASSWLADDAPTVFDDLHVHDLRHTAISLMCRAGYRPEWVAERVGHNDGGALILRNYRHLYPTEMSAVAWARIADFVGQRDLTVTANTYTHGLVDEAELAYEKLLATA